MTHSNPPIQLKSSKINFRALNFNFSKHFFLTSQYYLPKCSGHLAQHFFPCLPTPLYLPPANEVWDKVIFLHPSVILFTGRRVSAPLHAGVHPQADTPLLGRYPPLDTTGYGQKAGGTHPTGMHTCYLCLCAGVFLS